MPQHFRPAFGWQVRDVVLMGRARHVNLFAQPTADDEREVQKALAQLGIAALVDKAFCALSGGTAAAGAYRQGAGGRQPEYPAG